MDVVYIFSVHSARQLLIHSNIHSFNYSYAVYKYVIVNGLLLCSNTATGMPRKKDILNMHYKIWGNSYLLTQIWLDRIHHICGQV